MRSVIRSTLLLALCLTACAKKPSYSGSPSRAPTPEKPIPSPVDQVVRGNKKPYVSSPAPLKNLLFGFDVDTLTSVQNGRVTSDCLRYHGTRVLTGFASNERSGKYKEKASIAWNQSLSARRANSVRLAYTLSGCSDVSVQYFGETDKFGKRLEMNRRVTIQR